MIKSETKVLYYMKKIQRIVVFFSGAGGIRTLVQTRCKSAFYMFSLDLIFGIKQVSDRPTLCLSSKFSFLQRSVQLLSNPL